MSRTKFINPFDKGVTYSAFLKSVPKGKTVADHLKGKCTDEQVKWIESELKQYKNK